MIQPSPQLTCLLRDTGKVCAFYRLLTADGQVLHSKEYSRVKTYTISFTINSDTLFGEIMYFIVLNQKPFAIVSVLDIPSSAQEHFELTHNMLNFRLFPAVATHQLMIVPVNSICEKCISVNVGNLYLAKFTSRLFLD